MRSLWILTLTVLASGCEPARVDPNAVCDGLREPIADLVDVVVEEGTDRVVLATENVTVKYDAGC